MKGKMKRAVIKVAVPILKGGLKTIYAFMKLAPVNDRKILFCSRQSSDLPLDFSMLQEELIKRRDDLEIVSICNRLEGGANLSFGIDTLKSMRHMATSRVCVLDTYWPAASMLHHKDSLKIVQIWHAIGKIKKSGMISVGKATGRSADLASLVNMHENNDYIIAGAEIFDQCYYDSFGKGHYKLLNYGLPRIDYLLRSEEGNRKKFFEQNPELQGKPILLYVPTFRRGMEARWTEIIDAVDLDKYTLIIKNHPSQRIEGERPEGVYYFDDWLGMDLLAVCDYVITDYSAIALEAAVLRKKTCYWVYDYDEYVATNGLNVDMYQSMPGTVFKEADELMRFIDSGEYPMDVLENYRNTYLPEDIGHSTEKIATLILELLG